jgi:hypothetical protein
MASAGTFTLAGALLDVRSGCDTSINREIGQRGAWNDDLQLALHCCCLRQHRAGA